MKKKLKLKKREKELMDIDITSLLDILVILLVFLLKSYNASDLKLDLAKGLSLPNSKSRLLGNHAAIVQVNKNKELFINNKKIGNLTSGRKIASLETELKKIKEKEDEEEPKKNAKKKNRRNINIVLDRELQYKDMKKIMHTAAMVGYTNFKFIVKGDY